MSDLDRLTRGLQQAHERAQAGDQQAAEHARAFAQEIRRLQQAGPQDDPNRISGAERPFALFNQGAAGFVDSMAGPVNRGINRGLEAAGTDFRLDEQPAARLMDDIGARRAEPENLLERGVMGAGEGAAALLPAAGVLRGIAAGSGVMANAARTLLQGLATGTGVAAEVGAGAGAQIGGSLASDASGGNQIAEGLGQVAGGFGLGGAIAMAPSAVGAAGRGVMATPVTGNAIRAAQTAAAPFTRRGANIIAEDTFRGATADRFAAADRLADPNVGNLTPAQQTGDEGIMGIERARAAADPVFRSQLNQRTEAARGTLEREVSAPAQGRETRDLKQFFQERSERHSETVGRYVASAERRLNTEMRRIEPGMTREDASVMASGIIDDAFDRAARDEAARWARVPKDTMIPTTQAKQAYQAAVDEATRVAPETVPGKAHRFLGDNADAFGDEVPMAELYKLYSRVRRAGREAMALTVPDEETARRSNMIAEGILRDIEAAEGFQQGARLLADARAISTQIAEQFGQGNVSRILARTRVGGERIPAEMTLRSTIAQPREAGGVAVDDIRRATGSAADRPMQDFMRDDFTEAVRRQDGQVDPGDVTRFAEGRREALQRFPDGVGAEVEAVRRAASEVVRRRDRVDTIVSALNETQRGTVAGVANAPKGREIARGIFEADNPSAAARTIARAAQRDSTGDAYLGLKAGLYDEVISRSGGRSGLSGEQMARTLADPEMSRVLRAALPAGELSRLKTISAQMRKIERSMAARNVDTENLPNSLISTFIQIQSAKAGRAMGTGTIQVPGMFTARARQILARVFNDRADAVIKAALEDPQIMSDLLIGASARPERIRQAEGRLTNWAIGTLAASNEE